MSGPSRSFSAQESLKRRFALWSLAIFGSLSGSGAVRLNDARLWAMDEPQAGSQPAGDAAAADKNEPLTRQSLLALTQAEKFDEAIERVDATLAADPSPANYYLAYLLAYTLGQKKPDLAIERLQQQNERLAGRLGPTSSSQEVSNFVIAAQLLSQLLDRQGKTEQALKEIDKASQIAETKASQTQQRMTGSLLTQRCNLLKKLGRIDEAKKLLDTRVEQQLAKAEAGDAAAMETLPLLEYARLLQSEYPDEVQQVCDRAENVLKRRLEKDAATFRDYALYQDLQLLLVDLASRDDPEAADQRLTKLEEAATEFADRVAENERVLFERSQQTLKSRRSMLAASLMRAKLIGQPAPELDIGAVVNMDKLQLSDLKGKVVLLDFWAIWCGPCIATFPHLQHWREEFADRGLVIIGVTRQYGYAWDEEAQKPVSKKGTTLEEELAMLEEFRKKHALEHGFVVTPEGSTFSKKFGVTGIPQAVLLDQNGVIQLIRVGSGDANAQDIESKIQELLGTPAQAATKPAG
jgi:thiol-disulfide isomerase/thioredoxin